MKIITLHQPWASLVALGLKRYETRHWPTNYRGQVLIHAAKQPFMSRDGSRILNQEYWYVWLRALELAHESGLINDQSRLPLAQYLPLGSIVAIADLSNCLQMVRPEARTERYEPPTGQICINYQTRLELTVGDWQAGRYAFQLDNARPLSEPIPFTSRQGKLLDVPPALQLMVENQLAERVA